MFQSATVKLTAMYVGILMVICLLFSSLLYKVLSNELRRNYANQANFFADREDLPDPARDPQIIRFLDRQLSAGKQRVFLELVYINISLLLTGGIASYFLARRTLQPIEEAHEAQTRFTADASHELRTPLATMQTEIEVALRDPKLKLSQSKELLSSNLEEISTLRQLTSGLLTLARANESTPVPQSTKLKTALDEALARTQKAADAKEIALQTEVPEKITVGVDRSHLIELLVILIDNAVKYSPNKAAISIKATDNNQQVVVQVEDHGIGISEVDLPHVFERFYRADNARTKSKQNGHGLGLAIAKQLTQQYGGTISIASKKNKGTTVSLDLPRA